jgi:hypothetical protein
MSQDESPDHSDTGGFEVKMVDPDTFVQSIEVLDAEGA